MCFLKRSLWIFSAFLKNLVFSKLHSTCPKEYLQYFFRRVLNFALFLDFERKIFVSVVNTVVFVFAEHFKRILFSKITQLKQPELVNRRGKKLHSERMIFFPYYISTETGDKRILWACPEWIRFTWNWKKLFRTSFEKSYLVGLTP